MTVRGIHHDHVDPGLGQELDALFRTLAHADRRADTQAALLVLAGQRMLAGLEDILYRHQPAQFKCIIDHQHALEAVLVHQAARFFQAGIFLDGNQPLARRHDVLDRLVQIGLEAQVAVGDDTDHLLALRPPASRNPVLPRQSPARRAPSCPA